LPPEKEIHITFVLTGGKMFEQWKKKRAEKKFEAEIKEKVRERFAEAWLRYLSQKPEIPFFCTRTGKELIHTVWSIKRNDYFDPRTGKQQGRMQILLVNYESPLKCGFRQNNYFMMILADYLCIIDLPVDQYRDIAFGNLLIEDIVKIIEEKGKIEKYALI